jgi:ketosteroid isomerase-like protein
VTFDLAAYKRAFEAKDVEAWIAFYAEDAEWIEYTPEAPPRAPAVMRGRAAIRAFLEEVAADPMRLSIRDEVSAGDRAAWMVVCELSDGRRAIENTVATLREGLIVRQVEVESWD